MGSTPTFGTKKINQILFEDGIDDSKIRIETLAPIAKALDVDIDYLLGKEEAEMPTSLKEASIKIYEQFKPIREQLQRVTNIMRKMPRLTDKQIQMLESLIESYDDGQNLDKDENPPQQ